MMTSSEVFQHFNKKFIKLRDKYELSYLELNPCSIRTNEDLRAFIQKLEDRFFFEEHFSIVDEESKENEVVFLFNEESISFKIDKKFGHIEPDFFKIIEYLALLSDKRVANVNPTGTIVAGDTNDMKLAWNEGLPVYLDEFYYFCRNTNGRKFKKRESRNSFILNEIITPEYYQKIVLRGLNSFFVEKKKEIRYQKEQVQLFIDNDQSIAISLNGSYTGKYKKEGMNTHFDSSFINQIFLLNHWSLDTGEKLTHTVVGETEKEITMPLKEYISTFGRGERFN